MKLAPSPPPELPDVPSAAEVLPGPELLVGRPYALPVDLLGELYGELFYADFDGERKLWLELCEGEEVCLRLAKVTDLDDRPLPHDAATREALRRHLEAFHERRRRFGRWVPR